jgi:hypothetical protein
MVWLSKKKSSKKRFFLDEHTSFDIRLCSYRVEKFMNSFFCKYKISGLPIVYKLMQSVVVCMKIKEVKSDLPFRSKLFLV